MKRVLLTISFDGTGYHGWQYQPNAVTIQETLQKTIEKVIGTPVSLTGCSRTDAGVHAKMFCCHIDCNDNLPMSAFLSGVNSCLPRDISINNAETVPSGFHARYSCKSKRYIYNFYTGSRDPFFDRYALLLPKEPDIKLMNDFCAVIKGTHDFAGFSSSRKTVTDTIRTVFDCSTYSRDNFILFDIIADGFLYNMVRILAGTALEVGYGKLNPEIAYQIFKTKDRDSGGDTLVPKGLFLYKVNY